MKATIQLRSRRFLAPLLALGFLSSTLFLSPSASAASTCNRMMDAYDDAVVYAEVLHGISFEGTEVNQARKKMLKGVQAMQRATRNSENRAVLNALTRMIKAKSTDDTSTQFEILYDNINRGRC